MSSIPLPAGMTEDDLAVQRCGFVLLIYGILNITVGALLLLASTLPSAIFGGLGDTLAYASIGAGVLNMVLGYLTLENNYVALMLGFILVLTNLLVSIITLNYLLLIFSAAIALYLSTGLSALGAINARVDRLSQTDALTSYYHHLIPILVHVMKADGHVDRRERRKLLRAIDGMRISRYEQNRLVEKAVQRPELDLVSYINAFLIAARNARLPNPEHQLLLSTLAVASADGLLVDEEAETIFEIARHAGIPKGEAETLIEQERAKLDGLTLDEAHKLLGVSGEDDLEAVGRAYRTLSEEFKSESYGHLGAEVARYAEDRKVVIERAYNLISQSHDTVIGPPQSAVA